MSRWTGGEPVEDESAAAGVGGVQVGEGGQQGARGGDRVASFGQQARSGVWGPRAARRSASMSP